VVGAADGRAGHREDRFTSEDWVRAVIHNFNEDGFDSLPPKYAGTRPPTFTLPQRREIKKVALARPEDLDLPFSTWSLSKLAGFLVAEGVIGDISHEGLRVLLRGAVGDASGSPEPGSRAGGDVLLRVPS
jgi:transposase